MLNFFRQAKAQILLISNYETHFYLWENKTLSYVSQYTDQVREKYKDYPAIIVTNFVEESFRHDAIPPISGKDRKVLLNRKLNHAFRKTKYRAANLFERQEEGRKDHKVVLSGLTKPELLSPWVTPLLDKRTPIQSITSTTFLAEAFAQNADIGKEEYLLIVSLENKSEFRQTFLKKGKILFSRLTSLSSQTTADLGNDIYKESIQIRSYLERIKILPYEKNLKIKIYSIFGDNDLRLNRKTNNLNSFECINIKEDMYSNSRLLSEIEPGASIYFLSYLLHKKQIKNAYAPDEVRKYFHLKTLSHSLVFGSIAVIVLSLLITAPTLIDTRSALNNQQQVSAQTQPLLTEYNQLTQSFPETPIDSKEMALIVETYERINAQSYLPTDAMNYISSKLVVSPDLQITEITWAIEDSVIDNNDPDLRYTGMIRSEPQNAFQYSILDNRSKLVVLIKGMAYSPNSYREAQSQVQIFNDALAEHPGVTVLPLQMPTEVRVDSPLATTIDNNEVRAPFSLQLTIEYLR